MTSQTNDVPTIGIETRSLAKFISELNIARRNSLAYPKGHPVIAASFVKVLHSFEELLDQREELILGITSDTLMVDGIAMNKSNVVYRDFSRSLFERGIGVIIFHRGLSVGELTNFITILGLKHEQISNYGGIENLWDKAGITAIMMRPIRYDLFRTTDDDAVTADRAVVSGEGLWDRFAKELTLQEITYGSSDDTSLDPEILAKVLNRQFALGSISETEIRAAIASFSVPVDVNAHPDILSGQPYQKLAAFISNLTPELRRQFLDSSFESNSQDRQTTAERIITSLSDSAILETIEDISNNRLSVSPIVFGLLQRMGQNINTLQDIAEESLDETDLTAKMKMIFQEHAAEEFVPADYQNRLNHFIASEQIPHLALKISMFYSKR